MEDQLGALGIVSNCLVLWNTVYIDAAIEHLRAQGCAVPDEDVARLSPFIRKHINVHGRHWGMAKISPKGAVGPVRYPPPPSSLQGLL